LKNEETGLPNRDYIIFNINIFANEMQEFQE